MHCSSGVRHPIDSFGRSVVLLLPARQRKFVACLHSAVRARREVYTLITCSRVSYAPPDAQRVIHCSSRFRQCSAISAAAFRSQTRLKLVRRPQPRAPCSPTKAGACWPAAGRLHHVVRRLTSVAPTFVRADSASCPTSTRRTQPSAQQTARRCCARSVLLACQARPPATACARTHRSCVWQLRSHG